MRDAPGAWPMKDPVIEEVRKARMEHTRKFKGDLAAICEDLRRIEAACGLKVVRLAPRRREPTQTVSPTK